MGYSRYMTGPRMKIQYEIVQYLRYKSPEVFFWSNYEKALSGLDQALGLRLGVPSIFIARQNKIKKGLGPKYMGFFVFTKAHGKDLTLNQRQARMALREAGYYCCVASGLEEFKKEWEDYVNGK